MANLPVNISEDVVHGKGAGIQIVLVPYAPADMEAIVRLVNSIVDGDDDGQKPREQGQNLICDDGAIAVRLPLTEGVPCDGHISTLCRTGIGGIIGLLQDCHPAMMSALLCQLGDAMKSYDDAVRVPYLEHEGIKDEMLYKCQPRQWYGE